MTDNNELDNEPDAILDTGWIQEFDRIDKQYDSFYLDEVSCIRIHCIYIDKNNQIVTVKERPYNLKIVNYLSREELLSILKMTSFMNQSRYKLLSMLQYNFDLDPQNIQSFLSIDENCESISNQFCTIIKNIDTIKWNKTIKMFRELNSLYFVFHENSSIPSCQTTTKKIRFSSKSTHGNHHNKTYRKLV